jgi:L-lactate permease
VLPLITLFVLLGGLKLKAHVAALWSLAVALLVAIAVYSMPVGQAFDAGAEGAVFGLFPIMFIVIDAIWIFNMLERSGHFAVIRRSFGRLSNDQRVQAVLIAFCFGALLEALAGFGTPVAICSVMLIGLGFQPIKAAAVALVANTAPVAFGAIAMISLRVRPRRALEAYAATLNQLKFAILTVATVLALAYVMNLSGQTITIGNWLAGAGTAFALLSPILGWLGVAVTGSDTSSNALFGALQVSAAEKAHLSPMLIAANSSGGVLGKMISPQNLAIGAAAVGMGGQEGDLFRRVVKWSLILLAAMVLIVYLQSTCVLSWMVVGS